MAKIFVTRQIPQEGIKLLKGHNVTVSKKKRVLTKKELHAGAKKADVLLCLLTDKIDAAFIKKNKHLKVIANYAVGFDNVDVKAATQAGIPVTNTPGVLTDAVADHAVALILSSSRRVAESDRFVRKGKYKGWEPMLLLGGDFRGKTLGIVGSGRIGTAVAERMIKGFGMKCIYYDVAQNPFMNKLGAQKKSLMDVAKQSDNISVHVPLLPTTKHLINAAFLRNMKKSAYIVNTSRGPVVDEKALVSALKKKQIAGAGLDVFENEPKLTPGLTKLENVTLTPHTASATITARGQMSEIAARNILAVLAGKRAPNIVNADVYR